MAVDKKPNPEPDPLITLTEETRKEIEGYTPHIENAYKDLEALESLGMDTSRQREKLDWAAKAQKVILERLSKRQ